MNVAAIGIGGAGGRIVDRLGRELGTGGGSPVDSVHAIDTDTDSLDALGAVPADARHAIGQFETGGEGTDGDRELGGEIVEDERMEIRRAVEDGIPTTVDAIVVAAGLAGGTGSAVTPALVAGLTTVYEQPVYAVSILPAADDSDERGRQNTAQALTGLDESATAQIVFDNNAWLYGNRSLESHGDRINGALTARLGQLLAVGQETDGAVGQQVVDTRDVMGTLEGGGLVTLGYASRAIAAWRGASSSLLDGLKRRVLGENTEEYERGRAVQRTLSWATRGTLTFDCPRGAATHGLVVFRGPNEWLRGDAVLKGREWLADRAEIERLRSGDAPSSGTASLDVLVVLAGIEQTPQIKRLTNDADETADDPSNWGVAPGESGADGESTATEGSEQGGETDQSNEDSDGDSGSETNDNEETETEREPSADNPETAPQPDDAAGTNPDDTANENDGEEQS